MEFMSGTVNRETMTSKYVKDLKELGGQLTFDGFPVSAAICKNSATRMYDMELLICNMAKEIVNKAEAQEIYDKYN